jgi:hypothetical protein
MSRSRSRPRFARSRARASRVALGLCVVGVSLAVGTACTKSEDSTFLQPIDLELPEGLETAFDPNNVVDSAWFTEIGAFDGDAVQRFFHKTPYDRSSFLETYQSNGVRASDAIARAAATYRINPLVFLVEAQVTQGLIGAAQYPFPPERVEYVFRCGCLQGDDCVPELAGFDRQVDCLARSLRVALDQINTGGMTTSGWGLDKTSTTLDNVQVTPATEATAALYDHRPRVAERSGGGTWLFWNLWNVYSTRIVASGPFGGEGAGIIGDPCSSAASCAVAGATCATNYPGGMCTLGCTGECPSPPEGPAAFCADFKANGGFCMAVCNPAASSCRDGYTCARIGRFGASDAADAQFVCTQP